MSNGALCNTKIKQTVNSFLQRYTQLFTKKSYSVGKTRSRPKCAKCYFYKKTGNWMLAELLLTHRHADHKTVSYFNHRKNSANKLRPKQNLLKDMRWILFGCK